MVRKYTKNGHPYDEPPYTEEEKEYLRRHMQGDGSPITVAYSGPAGKRQRVQPAKQGQKGQSPKQEEEPRS
jgi:hypothetical protein